MKKSFTQPFWRLVAMQSFSKRAGFTLIELLIVLVIIGILTALAVPKFERIILKSKMMKRVPILEQIRLAELTYHMETGQYFFYAPWAGPHDPVVKENLGLDIPPASDYGGEGDSSFTVLTGQGYPLSAWLNDDARLAGYYAYTYASQGTDGDGYACIIMCYGDDQLNVKRICIKYLDGDGNRIDDPIEDIIVK